MVQAVEYERHDEAERRFAAALPLVQRRKAPRLGSWRTAP